MRASTELLYMITRNNNAFLTKNLTRTFTTDKFSCTNLPRGSDQGFIRNNARSFTRNVDGQVTLITKNTKRTQCINKKRRGVLRTTFNSQVVDSKKLTLKDVDY